jgi:hypothetical protein
MLGARQLSTCDSEHTRAGPADGLDNVPTEALGSGSEPPQGQNADHLLARRRDPPRGPHRVPAQGPTPWSTTGPSVGSSSVAWETPAGVIVSTTFGTVFGSTEQIGAVPPGAHTPKV